jgi:hypothetical protein
MVAHVRQGFNRKPHAGSPGERRKGDVSLGPMPIGRDRNQLIDALADMPLSGYNYAGPNARSAAKAET